jgi:hypothetical protein
MLCSPASHEPISDSVAFGKALLCHGSVPNDSKPPPNDGLCDGLEKSAY